MQIVNRKTAPFFMVFISFLWGSSYVCVKQVTNYIHPVWGFFLNSALCLVFVLLIYGRQMKGFDKRAIVPLIWLTVSAGVSNLTNIVAVKYTSSTNAAFIVQLSIVFVPLILGFMQRKMPSRRVILSCVIAMVGLAILTLDFSDLSVNPGDALMVVCALAFAVYLIALAHWNELFREADVLVTYYVSAALCGAAMSFWPGAGIEHALPLLELPFMIGYLGGVVALLLASILQVEVSRHIKTEVLSTSYCMEPLFTAAIAYVALGERLQPVAWFGIALILCALVLLVYKQDIEFTESKHVVSKEEAL